MPLETKITRNGGIVKLRWSHFHIASMVVALMLEAPEEWDDAKPNEGIDYPTEPQPIGPGDVFQIVSYPIIAAALEKAGSTDYRNYTLKNDHKFLDTADGEVFELKTGDTLSFWRS